MSDPGTTTLNGESTLPDGPSHAPDIGEGFAIGEYRITGVLGQGSMGTVYLARDNTGHDVALKMFREGLGNSKMMSERFRREAEATKKLRRHPYILTVYTSGQEGAYHYIAMEHVQNSRTFKTLVSEGLPKRETIHTAIKLASALQYAHEHGIIHRDVKPENVLVDEFNEPLLADFGVADIQHWPGFTATGALTGTPMYMSPEQARAETLSPASDVYSLAVLLYEALLGKLPYDLPAGYGTSEVLEMVKINRIVRPRRVDRGISRDLEFVLMKAMSADPKDRYLSARAFARDLESVYDGRSIPARFASPLAFPRHLIRKHALLVALVVGLCLAAAAGYLFLQKQLNRMNEQQLLHLAWQRSAELNIGANRLWNTMEEAMKERLAGRWKIASEHFRFAGVLASQANDARNRLNAHLEEARCYQMLGTESGLEETETLYKRILDDTEESPAIARQALFELVLLHLSRDETEEAAEWFYADSELLQDTPLGKVLMSVMEGEGESVFKEHLFKVPLPIRNDAWFAWSLRPGQAWEGRRQDLATTIKSGRSAYDWPSPLAEFYLVGGGP